MSATGDRRAVALAGAGADWESRVLHALSSARDLVVLKRCVDLPDLLAAGSTGRVDVAVLAAELPGLDAAAVRRLSGDGGASVVVVAAHAASAERAAALGPVEVVAADRADVADAVVAAARRARDTGDAAEAEASAWDLPLLAEDAGRVGGPVVAVTGPPGAPGRTTLATTLAAVTAAAAHRCLVVDLDPYGGAVGQHLGVLEDVSGVLAASRLANDGRLDTDRFASVVREVGGAGRGRLEVLTGLPRPDRWPELHEGVVAAVLERARERGPVVVDAGVDLVDPDQVRPPRRSDLVDGVLEAADVTVVVASPDPVGLARLSRALVHRLERGSGVAGVHVVVNRMRASLTWGEGDVRGMVEGLVGPVPMSFLPEDQASCDRALAAGRSVAEDADAPLAAAVAALGRELGLAAAGEARPRSHRGRRRR